MLQSSGEKSKIQTFGFREKYPKVEVEAVLHIHLAVKGWKGAGPASSEQLRFPLNLALHTGPLFIFRAVKSFASLGSLQKWGFAMISSHCGAKLPIS